MIAKDLRDLGCVASSSLIETGRFPDGWLEAYRLGLAQASNLYSGESWPKELFASLHYASTHLCLRYYARKETAAARIAETETTLGGVHLDTEVFFWTEISKLQHWKSTEAPNKHEETLVSLCFGSASPVTATTDRTMSREWQQSYERCLGSLQSMLRHSDNWNKWLCVALHFAAFYLDFYRQRDIDLGLNSETGADATASPLVARLSDSIENQRVLALIELWLKSTACERSMTGVPKLGKARLRTEGFVSVRTATEILIQSGTESSGE